VVEFGDGKDTTTGLFPSPCSVEVSHVYTQEETCEVSVTLEDWKGTPSAPKTVTVPVGKSGGVRWYWWDNDEDQGALTTSAIVASDGEDEVVMAGCEDDFKFYAVKVLTGKDKKSTTTRWPEWVFTGHPGLANGHVIVGSDEGELYALNLDGLNRAWMWPGKPAEESLTYIEWGAPAFNGQNIYISHDDDKLYLFQDAGSQGNYVTAYVCNAAVVDAPIIDATGNVIFGTDSGYLIKIDGGLASPIWRTPLLANGQVNGPILGADGTIYCTSDSFRVYSVSADGAKNWSITVDGEVSRPVLGQTALFVASSFGNAYAINPATGGIVWQKSLSTSDGFSTSPVVAANGYVYFQSDADVLYCVNQADGTVIWSCNCPRYLPRSAGRPPHRPRKAGVADYPANPSIASNGDIIVVGADALYCVAGYENMGLDASAAWPKWQKNLYNTGK
jgi:outer membrane protein assembly factor BamB